MDHLLAGIVFNWWKKCSL